jgi:hypothetical protein
MPVIALGLALACSPSEEEADVAVESGLENGSFTADLNGYNIHYEVHGQGPVLMTVPNSWGFSLEGLRALYRPLEAHLTMVYFDPRGMGESDPIQFEEDMGLGAVRADFDTRSANISVSRRPMPSAGPTARRTSFFSLPNIPIGCLLRSSSTAPRASERRTPKCGLRSTPN